MVRPLVNTSVFNITVSDNSASNWLSRSWKHLCRPVLLCCRSECHQWWAWTDPWLFGFQIHFGSRSCYVLSSTISLYSQSTFVQKVFASLYSWALVPGFFLEFLLNRSHQADQHFFSSTRLSFCSLGHETELEKMLVCWLTAIWQKFQYSELTNSSCSWGKSAP